MADEHTIAENIARHLLFMSKATTKNGELESLVESIRDMVSHDVFQTILQIILMDKRPAASRLFALIIQHNATVGLPVTTNRPVDQNDVCENTDENTISNMSNIINNIEIVNTTSRGRHSRLEARVDLSALY